ncbi:hypothetical protein EC968_003520 [Mortierella alpina]|nr:hypothetical protein EC968_003520 [Mortierella alpina]
MNTPAFLILLIACLFVSAQGEAPIPATASAYETVDEKTLYIHGGITDLKDTVVVTNQFFALDFTINWTSSSPPWKSVNISSAMGAPKAWGHSMVFDRTSNSLVLWSTVTQGRSAVGLTTYSISNSSWTPTNDILSDEQSGWFKLRSATDPRTGLIYVPSGKNNGSEMAVYRADGSISPGVMMPSAKTMVAAVTLSTVVWSTQRNSLLIYGGKSHWDPTALNPHLVEYSPQTSKWKRLPTNGTSPGSLVSHCMVPAYNGTKMVVFGGALFPDVVTVTNGRVSPAAIMGSIYILDIQSLTWTRGADTEPQHIRSDMACGVSGDNFVAWGGIAEHFIDIVVRGGLRLMLTRFEGMIIGEIHSEYIGTLGTPIIYNIKTNSWTKEFIQTVNLKSDEIPSITTTSNVTPTGGSVVDSDDGSNMRRNPYGHESENASNYGVDPGIEQQLALLEARRQQQYQAHLMSLQRLRQEHEEQLQALQKQLQSRSSSMAFP